MKTNDERVAGPAVSLCHRYKLDLIAVYAEGKVDAGARSFLVAHVRDRTGQQLVLKRTTPERGPSEIAALRAWGESGRASRLVAVLEEPDLYLAEWLQGLSMAQLPDQEPLDATAVGRMLRGLHNIAPPPGLPPVRDRFVLPIQESWSLLSPVMRSLGQNINTRLFAYQPPRAVLLHGDLVPLNVLLTPDGPKVIDPVGQQGLPAWDLAQLTVAVAGRNNRRILPTLLDGYDAVPPLLADAVAWMILFFLQKNLAEHRPAFVAHLRPVADQLVGSGDAETFLRRFLHSDS